MEIRLEEGKLLVPVDEVFQSLSDEELRGLVDTLACEDAIIVAVAAQILDGWTEMESHGAKSGTAPVPRTPLDRAIREVAKRSGEVAKEEIERLVDQLKYEIQTQGEYTSWAFDLSSWVDAGMIGPRPSILDHKDAPITGEHETRHEIFKRRLKEMGMYEPSSDYGGLIGRWVEELSEILAMQRHSGVSAQTTIGLFVHLMEEYNNDGV